MIGALTRHHKNGRRLVRVNSLVDALFRSTRLLAGTVFSKERLRGQQPPLASKRNHRTSGEQDKILAYEKSL